MRVILNTNVFLWIISDDQRVSTAARETYLDDDTIPILSMASIWEMMIKSSIGKLESPPTPGQLMEEQLRLTACTILDITIEHRTAVASLPFHHRHPSIASSSPNPWLSASRSSRATPCGTNTAWRITSEPLTSKP